MDMEDNLVKSAPIVKEKLATVVVSSLVEQKLATKLIVSLGYVGPSTVLEIEYNLAMSAKKTIMASINSNHKVINFY
jgi:hypothetical protein